jgi:hypothetical protein
VESQRRASEAAAKVQEEARGKARESERIAQAERQQRGRNVDNKVQGEAEKKGHGNPALSPKHEQITSEPVSTNVFKKAQQKKGKGKPSPLEEPAAPPKSP